MPTSDINVVGGKFAFLNIMGKAEKLHPLSSDGGPSDGHE